MSILQPFKAVNVNVDRSGPDLFLLMFFLAQWQLLAAAGTLLERHTSWGKYVEAKARLRYDGASSGSNSMVESQPSKLLVAGSIPASRSRLTC